VVRLLRVALSILATTTTRLGLWTHQHRIPHQQALRAPNNTWRTFLLCKLHASSQGHSHVTRHVCHLGRVYRLLNDSVHTNRQQNNLQNKPDYDRHLSVHVRDVSSVLQCNTGRTEKQHTARR
jgi:hypothetical protein